jgi:hypothetical protein
MFATLLLLSVLGGVLSGLLGVGGAVVMIPLMLSVPPLVGVGALTMKQVAGISMLQVLASSISGLLVHRGNGQVNGRALSWVGFPMAGAALVGGWASKFADDQTVLAVFAALMVVALVLLIGFKRDDAQGALRHGGDIPVDPARAAAIGVGVGIASGMAGAGGGFLVVPLMMVVLRMPLKVTVGTSLGIVFLGSLAGAIGKILADQVEWRFLLPVLIGSIPAARLGAKLSHALPSRVLRLLLLVLVALSLVKSVWTLWAG